MSTDPGLTRLARAEKDGKPVHAGLRNACVDQECQKTKGYILWTGEPYTKPGYTDFIKHPECNGNQYIPNPDPMALIAAAWEKDWTVNFESDESVNIYVADSEGDVTCYIADADTWDEVYPALTDAMVQATRPIEPDNWVDCENCHGLGGFEGMPSGGPMGEDPFPDEMCQECTGIVIKEATNGN